MAKRNTQSKTTKRQPAKSRLSSTGSKTAKKLAAKKKVNKTGVKQSALKKSTVTKPRTAKKPAPKKSSVRKKQPQLQISIPLTRHTRLVAAIQLSKVPPKKRPKPKKTAKAKSSASKKQSPKAKQLSIAVVSIVLGLLGSAYFGLHVLAAVNPPAPVDSGKPIKVTVVKKQLPASPAVRLSIPALGVDAEVIKVGLKADNTLEVPTDYSQVGEYNLAPTPGEIGPSVLVGHVDSFKGPAVFWRLRELQPGQEIVVQRADQTTAKFKVTHLKDYPQDQFPTTEVYGNIDHAGLRLITCSGSFNLLSQQYSNNIVVFAELV